MNDETLYAVVEANLDPMGRLESRRCLGVFRDYLTALGRVHDLLDEVIADAEDRWRVRRTEELADGDGRLVRAEELGGGAAVELSIHRAELEGVDDR